MDINTLRNKIEEANILYRSGSPIMSDAKYDELVEDLFKLSPNDDFFKNIGHKISDRKMKLPIEMASMNKIKTIDELNDWVRLKNIPLNTILVLTPKYDGLSVGVNEQSKLAFTRGDGEFGQESTNHFSLVSNKNDKTEHPFEYSYGELVMYKSIFNEKYSNDFSNPRNLVGGLMNSKEPSNMLKDCSYIRYGIQNIIKNIFNTKTQILDYLNNLQKISVPYEVIRISDITEDFIIDAFKRWSVDFEIDGIIIEVNDLNTQLVLGRETSSNNPVWARAFKHISFEQSVISEVIGITWNISKQGMLKPIVHISPVRVDGVTVSNITGNNARYIKEMGIGVGAIVKLVRSGMVIPKIVSVIKRVDFEIPNIPNIIWDDRNIDLITIDETDDQKFKKMVAFFSILETDNVSEGVIKQLWNSGFDTIEKVLNVKQTELESLEGFGKRKSKIVFDSIRKSTKDVSLARLMHASTIFNSLGEKKLVLLEHFKTKPTLEEVISIDGFAEKSAEVFINNYDKFYSFIENLPISIKIEERVSTSTNLPLSGMTFVFTGIRLKDEEINIINLGGSISNSISKNTNYLICKDPNASSSKLEKAKKLGISILSVENFISFLESVS